MLYICYILLYYIYYFIFKYIFILPFGKITSGKIEFRHMIYIPFIVISFLLHFFQGFHFFQVLLILYFPESVFNAFSIFYNAVSLQIRFWVCTPSNEALRIRLTTTLQLRYFGCAPPPYSCSRIIVPWDKPSLCGSRTPCSRTLPLSLSLFSCTSPSWSVWPLTGLSLFYVWVSNPGRHSSVGNTLTIQAFLLSGWVVVWFVLYI